MPSNNRSNPPATIAEQAQATSVEQRRNAVYLQEQVQNAMGTVRDNRPTATSTSYGHKQQQWRRWCDEKGFEDGHSVSGMKLLAWIQEELFEHQIEPCRGGKSASHLKREDPAEDADEVTRTFAAATIEVYVSAIVSLYNEQTQHGMNSYPHPRTPLVADLLASKKSQESKRRRVEYEDRGRGTLQEGYDQAQFSAMLRWCHSGFEKPVFLLRTGVDFLLAHHMLLRSEARRSMELADMFCVSLDNEGPTPCTALVVLLDHGKANKVGRVEYSAAVRHRDPEVCLLFNLSAYFVCLWEVLQRQPPNFQRRTAWYDVKLFAGRTQGTSGVSYETQREWTKKLLDAGGLTNMGKKTHLGRAEGAKFADVMGVDESHVRRAGHWRSDALTRSYLTNLPRPFMRAMAGFKQESSDNYWLPRAATEVPYSVERKLLPWVDPWLDWHEGRIDHTPVDDGRGDNRNDDLAAVHFLRLLKFLRKVFIQDSTVLRAKYPTHPVFQLDLFSTPEYLEYEKLARASAAEAERAPPAEYRLRQMMPDIAEIVRVTRDAVRQDVAGVSEQMTQFGSMLKDLCAGHVSLLPDNFGLDVSVGGQRTQHLEVRTRTSGSAPQTGQQEGGSSHARVAVAAPEASSSSNNPLPAAIADSTDEHPASTTAPANNGEPPQYRLSRSITTVPDVWREWNSGIGAGPAVQHLEDKYGSSWRTRSGGEGTLFCRRKAIVDKIRGLMRNGLSEPQAVLQLEDIRVENGFSLYALHAWLKGKR